MNLIMTSLYNSDYAFCEVFIKSWKLSNPQHRLVVFTHNVPEESINQLKNSGVEVEPLKILDPIMDRCRQLTYLEYLKLHTEINYACTCDARDVILQEDVFGDTNFDMCFGVEYENLTIKDCEINSIWIKADIKHDALNELKDKPISCAGATIGRRENFINYLNYFTDPDDVFIKPSSYSDQAQHNYIVWMYDHGKVKYSTPKTGPVVTTGRLETCNPTFIDGKISVHGMPPQPIVHQYDRQEKLKEIVIDYYLSLAI